uniref:Beta-hexosaminidase n=1 Tax=Cyprinus carpio carpio TaxID=630221 RepID=A0A9J7X8J3_CYPCA
MSRSGSHSHRVRWWCLIVAVVAVWVQQVEGVWPLPQQLHQSADRDCLSPQRFSFTYGRDSAAQTGCSVLDAAFKRYFSIIFPDFTTLSENVLQYMWSEPQPFVVSVSVKTRGCDGYPDEDSDESYTLSVSEGQAVLRSVSVWGALRGLESLMLVINSTEIVDFPRFAFRGLLLDTSRHYLPLYAILKTLDAMAYSKLNVFHWHIVDDPSFPYQSRTFPDLSNKGAFHPFTHIYTQSDVIRVIEHARMRGIRVVPEFDSPGHTQSWGKGQPGLLTPCYKGSVPSGSFGPVDPTVDTTYKFMASLLKEVKFVFPDSYVHLGGDEVSFACWQSNPNVRKFMEKMGFGKDFTKLESFYMESIMNMTAALNKTSIVWQDVFDYHERPRSKYVVEVWKQGCYLCKMRRVTKAGLKVILAAPFYLDLPIPTHSWARYYNVRPLAFRGTDEQKKLVIGGEVAMWGEYVDATNLSPRLWPRACAAAERLWSNEEKTLNADLAFPRLKEFRCELLRRGIQAEPLFVGHCRHEYDGL